MMMRQGEVYLTQILKLPDGLVAKDNVLARGEATGHKHQVQGNAQVFADANGMQYIQVLSDSELVHEEHGTIPLTKGLYQVTIQREYDLLRDEIRQVTD